MLPLNSDEIQTLDHVLKSSPHHSSSLPFLLYSFSFSFSVVLEPLYVLCFLLAVLISRSSQTQIKFIHNLFKGFAIAAKEHPQLLYPELEVMVVFLTCHFLQFFVYVLSLCMQFDFLDDSDIIYCFLFVFLKTWNNIIWKDTTYRNIY